MALNRRAKYHDTIKIYDNKGIQLITKYMIYKPWNIRGAAALQRPKGIKIHSLSPQ